APTSSSPLSLHDALPISELAQAEALFQKTQREHFLAQGVTMSAPDTVHFAWDTDIGAGTTIEPFVVFGPGARVAEGARIRSFSRSEEHTSELQSRENLVC